MFVGVGVAAHKPLRRIDDHRRWCAPDRCGGALNTGHLLISNSIVTANRATAGGGIANAGGTVTVSHSSVTGNRAPFYGGGGIQNGGIRNVAGTVEVITSTVAGNTSGGDGGGILNGQNGRPAGAHRPAAPVRSACPWIPHGGALEAAYAGTPGRQIVLDSTLTSNKALAGGAIDDSTDTLYVTASTLAGNSANLGGAIEVEGGSFVYLRSSTLTGNFAKSGTGGAIDTYGCGGGVVSYTTIAGNSSGLNLPCSNLQITGSIIAASALGPNCAGAAPHESAGYNLDTGVSCAFTKPTDLTAANPQLGPLAANGGPTQTRAPENGSPAIDHGGTRATGCPATDQRGRVQAAGAGLRHGRRRGTGTGLTSARAALATGPVRPRCRAWRAGVAHEIRRRGR
jgi:hypothetical protein